MDRHRFDADPDTYPDATFHFAADPDLDRDRDPDPSSTPSCTHVGISEKNLLTSIHGNATVQRNSIYVVAVSDLCNPRIGPHMFLQQNRQIGCGNI